VLLHPETTSFYRMPTGNESADGEICIRLNPAPTSLMAGFVDDPELTANVMGGFKRLAAGDVAGVIAATLPAHFSSCVFRFSGGRNFSRGVQF